MTATRFSTRSFVALLAIGSLGLAACGSDDAGDELPEPAPATDQPADDAPTTDQDDADPAPDPAVVIGSANVGGTIVDSKPHAIDDIAIAESFPEQLMVRFTAGDAGCLAATATATASGDSVVVSLVAGITENAMATTCRAGEFEHTLSIGLDEGLGGRTVVAAEA